MIEVKNLTKKYGDHIAVDNLNFTVEKGKIYGFLGPNGAGKSTTMNIITGCLAATDGEVRINGNDIFENPIEAKKYIGYLPEQPPLYFDMTPYEYLRFVAEAKGVHRGEIDEQIDEVLDITQIEDVQDRLIRNLSKGYKQRVGIAQAMLGHPEIIILDEPTVGLDPKQIIEIRQLIHSLGQKCTVILSSHILSEISAICDHVIIISRGVMVANDTLENLSSHYTGKSTMLLTVKGADGKIRMELNDIPEITEYELEPTDTDSVFNLKITIDRETDIREKLFNIFAGIGCPILSMVTESLSLEDVFLQLTKDSDEEIVEDEPEPEAGMENETEDDEEDEDETDDDNDDGYQSIFGNKREDD